MTRNGVVAAMAESTRISLSLPKKLLKEFDSLSHMTGQPNRSKAVSQAMREFVSSRRWDLSSKGEVPGVILLTYDHHSRGANRALTELQHDYPDAVTATMHIHLSKHTCLEIIAFKGSGDRVRSLARMLQAQKGVLDVKLVTSAV
ncbi:MAG: nickel-responsive transcriptional regulator NikR [Candidatus Thermoplasmatota archaeon]|nr:nickel-responsive transcriptional regulator NikR [Candidatus Thermoplasmatota archaeon]